VEFVVGWIIFSIVAGAIASAKGRSGFGYFLLSLFLSPLVGIILAWALPRISTPAAVTSAPAPELKSWRTRQCIHF
jgi:phosphate/sulfate permease